jgi:uncharacterized RDD family membrane protein YckC
MQPEHPLQTEPPQLVPATPWRRFMCIAYEGILLFGVLFFFGYGFSALAQFKGEPGVVRWIFQGFVFLVLAVYFTWSWSEGRQTLPMKTMGVRLVTAEGRPLTIARALARYGSALLMLLAAILSGRYLHQLFFLLIFLPGGWCAISRQKDTLYDAICRTRLIHTKHAA